MPGRNDCRIYVGNLPPDVREGELKDLFHKFGRINYIDLKVRRGSYSNPFAFIEFDDWRDADDAVHRRDGYNFDGYKLRVEYPHGDRGGSTYGGGSNYKSSGSSYSYGGGRPKGPPAPPLRSGYRVFVTGLPFSGSWQDLKDHLREAGDVCYADVFKDGTGVAEFVYKEDMRWAIRELDDTKFRSHEGDSSYIRIRADTVDDDYYGRGRRGRSISRSYSRSRSRSPSRSLTPSSRGSRSRSRSYSRSYSRSRSRSRSVSPKSKWSRYSRSRSRSFSGSRSPGGIYY